MHFTNYSSAVYSREMPGSLAILVALYNLYGQGLPVFDPVEGFSVYQFVDSSINVQTTVDFEAVHLLACTGS